MRFISFLLCVVLALSFTVNSFALELESPAVEVPVEGEPVDSGNDYLDLVLDNLQEEIKELQFSVNELQSEEVVSDEEVPTEKNPDLGIDEGTITGISLLSVAPITPEDTTGLKSVLLEVLGDYDPIIVEYEYQNNNNQYYSYLREVLPDYPWMASFLMLSLFVYCVFRLGGALIG